MQDENEKEISFNSISFDPTAKATAALKEKLDMMKDGKDLSKAKTSDEETLLPFNIDEKMLQGVHAFLSTIANAYLVLPSDGNSALDLSKRRQIVENVTAVSKDVGDLLMDGWHWIKEKIDDVVEWAIDTAGECKYLHVFLSSSWQHPNSNCYTQVMFGNSYARLRGRSNNSPLIVLKRFARPQAGYVRQSLTSIFLISLQIWEKLKDGWSSLCDYVGFIFNWQDILETKDTISSIFTAGFGYAANKVDDAVDRMDEIFGKIEDAIDQFGTSVKSSKSISAKTGPRDEKVDEAQSSTSCLWASERMKNGGAGTSTKVKSGGNLARVFPISRSPILTIFAQ